MLMNGSKAPALRLAYILPENSQRTAVFKTSYAFRRRECGVIGKTTDHSALIIVNPANQMVPEVF